MLENNSQGLFLFKKTEAIVSAIYLMSGLLSDQEPLKWRLRALGSEILEMAVSFFDRGVASTGSGTDSGVAIERCARLACSYLEVLVRGRTLSGRNVELVTQEIERLIQLFRGTPVASVEKIRAETEELLRAPSLGESCDEIALSPLLQQPGSSRAAVLSRKHSIPSFARDGKGSAAETGKRSTILQGTQNHRSAPQPRPGIADIGGNVARRTRFLEEADQRRSVILDLVRARGRVTVKDVARLLPQYSGKTAQRELIILVEKGVLHREGARRWSRYTLKDGSQLPLALLPVTSN
ncbi:MAG: DeoR family transcriptional regulator [Patescibacteria group bacterium]|nr:DeoR family transcriptional regulator [Patescibacteria group bacterium]